MRERQEQILKIVCVGLAVLLLVQLVKVVIHMNPLAGAVIPELPSLPADTNAVVKVANKNPAKPGTNSPASTATSKTNAPLVSADTNVVTNPKAKGSESNSAPIQVVAELAITAATNNLGTNALASASTDTNTITTKAVADTNAAIELAKTNSPSNTNAVAKKSGAKKSEATPPQMAGPGGKKPSGLPPEIQARVDRVTDSEILGPVVRPMPMALLGIAGNLAFLRSPSGQTGLVKEGDDLGEIKLLRIGTNRVLVEQDGQKKELMIFSGFGGESLLPKSTETSDETTKN
jgi:hypothetical protein